MPSLAEALENHRAERFFDAEAIYRAILARDPQNADALHFLGVVLAQTDRSTEGIALLRRSIELVPTHAETHNNLGNILKDLGRFDEALVCLQQALKLRPDFPAAMNNLASARRMQGHSHDAIELYRRALALPGGATIPEIHNNLGLTLREVGLLEESIGAFRRAIALRPNFSQAHNNLGNAYKDQGLLDEAIEAYRRAVELNPTSADAHSNLLYTMLFASTDSQAILAEHRNWNRHHAQPLAGEIQPHTNSRDCDRPLRIGYVSPDFLNHPVGRFLLPLFANLDRTKYRTICYSDSPLSDEMTARLRERSDEWHSIVGLPDAHLAERIRNDSIDILVDLSLHTSGNRLLTFARRPAPVQLSYLAYPGTTGMEAIDYRITDPLLDPPGNESLYTERSLPNPSYWCYHPPAEAGDVAPPPCLETGQITFGCLNNFAKVSPACLDTWADLFRSLPDSRLLIHWRDPSHASRVTNAFLTRGIDPHRIEPIPNRPLPDYFETYNQIDIALDPFPYAGGTTTCDALWMGVPVVTLALQLAVHRSGVSLLSHVNHSEWIAQTPAEYLAIASRLASDGARLETMRTTLRSAMRNSPLMDAESFARAMESAYAAAWASWCSS